MKQLASMLPALALQVGMVARCSKTEPGGAANEPDARGGTAVDELHGEYSYHNK